MTSSLFYEYDFLTQMIGGRGAPVILLKQGVQDVQGCGVLTEEGKITGLKKHSFLSRSPAFHLPPQPGVRLSVIDVPGPRPDDGPVVLVLG